MSGKKLVHHINVIRWIAEGVHIPFVDTPPSFHFPNHKFSFSHREFIANEIQSLLESGAIQICDPQQKPFCVSPIKCVAKKGGKFRLIVDLREINTHCSVPKFCYEDINVVTQLIQEDDYMVTLDLKNGFHHIPIAKEDQEYLGFAFRDTFYKWKVQHTPTISSWRQPGTI
jgi:hypothetical protein